MNKIGIIKKLSSLGVAAVFVLMASASAWGQLLVGYDFTGSSAPATFAPTTTAANVAGSNVTRGAGAAASAGGNSFRTTGFQNNGISTANTDYFQFAITATAPNRLSLSSLNAGLAGTATFVAMPGVSQQFAYSLNGTTFTLIGSPQSIVGTPATITVDLTGVAALQNVAAGTTVTFRYYASGQTATGGYGFFSSASGVNGLAINGTAVAPTAGEVSISGRVSAPQRFGSSSALVTLTDASGNSQTVRTRKLGGYRFSDLSAGETYVLTVSAKGYTFAPQIVTANEDLTDVDFAPEQ